MSHPCPRGCASPSLPSPLRLCHPRTRSGCRCHFHRTIKLCWLVRGGLALLSPLRGAGVGGGGTDTLAREVPPGGAPTLPAAGPAAPSQWCWGTRGCCPAAGMEMSPHGPAPTSRGCLRAGGCWVRGPPRTDPLGPPPPAPTALGPRGPAAAAATCGPFPARRGLGAGAPRAGPALASSPRSCTPGAAGRLLLGPDPRLCPGPNLSGSPAPTPPYPPRPAAPARGETGNGAHYQPRRGNTRGCGARTPAHQPGGAPVPGGQPGAGAMPGLHGSTEDRGQPGPFSPRVASAGPESPTPRYPGRTATAGSLLTAICAPGRSLPPRSSPPPAPGLSAAPPSSPFFVPRLR